MHSPVLMPHRRLKQLQRLSTGQILSLDANSPPGRGGEGYIYAVQGNGTLAAKVYHDATEARIRKVAVMRCNPPADPMAAQDHISIAWPIDLTCNTNHPGQPVGFLMPRVQGMDPLFKFYTPGTRRQQFPLLNYTYLHRTARNLTAAVSALHARGYVIGDVNASNVLVADTALVTLVDTDSFQVSDPENGIVYRCPVGTPEYTPPELQGADLACMDRVQAHDLFGLAVLIFQLLMEGTRPFDGVFQKSGEAPPIQGRIMAGHFVYGRQKNVPYRPRPVAPPFEILHPALRRLFIRCFEKGHKSLRARPDAQTWQEALGEAEQALISCAKNPQHRYGDHLSACPWCERTALLRGRDPFPSGRIVQRTPTRSLGVPAHKPPAFPQPTAQRPLSRLPKWAALGLFGLLCLMLVTRGFWWPSVEEPQPQEQGLSLIHI